MSLRQVAADASVDPALVRRFSGNKEQLFTAVASALIDPERALATVADGRLLIPRCGVRR